MKILKFSVGLTLCLSLCVQIAEAKRSKKGKTGDIIGALLDSIPEPSGGEPMRNNGMIEIDGDAFVNVRSSFVREQASQYSQGIGALSQGDNVHVESCSTQNDMVGGRKGNWCHVTYKKGSGCLGFGTKEGWVWGWNLVLI